MYVRDAMLSNPITTTPDETFDSLLGRLASSRQATAAALDPEGRLVGLVGIHDILHKLLPHYVELDANLMEVLPENYFETQIDQLKGLQVKDFMTTELDTVTLDDTLIKAVALIVEQRRKTLPVVDEEGRFLGMITRRTLLEEVVKRWEFRR